MEPKDACGIMLLMNGFQNVTANIPTIGEEIFYTGSGVLLCQLTEAFSNRCDLRILNAPHHQNCDPQRRMVAEVGNRCEDFWPLSRPSAKWGINE